MKTSRDIAYIGYSSKYHLLYLAITCSISNFKPWNFRSFGIVSCALWKSTPYMLHLVEKNNIYFFSNLRAGINDTVDDQLGNWSLFLCSFAEVVCKYLLNIRTEQDPTLHKHCIKF